MTFCGPSYGSSPNQLVVLLLGQDESPRVRANRVTPSPAFLVLDVFFPHRQCRDPIGVEAAQVVFRPVQLQPVQLRLLPGCA